jgi:hypothetical protein
MFKRVADDPAAISRGWSELEEALGSLRGRKFYGAFDATIREYRVCVEIREGDLPDELGLELGRLPGGRYLQVRLCGEPPGVYDLIAPCAVRELGFTRRGCIRRRVRRGGRGARRQPLMARHGAFERVDRAVRASVSGVACGCCNGRRRPGAHARDGADSRSAASRGTRHERYGQSAPRSRSPSARAPVCGVDFLLGSSVRGYFLLQSGHGH